MFIWKVRGGDVYEQELWGYECEIDAADDWVSLHNIRMEELEWVEVKER